MHISLHHIPERNKKYIYMKKPYKFQIFQAAVGLQPVSKRTSSFIANIIVVLQREREPSRPLPASSPQTKKQEQNGPYNAKLSQNAVGFETLSDQLGSSVAYKMTPLQQMCEA
jgi:hypothetical protein